MGSAVCHGNLLRMCCGFREELLEIFQEVGSAIEENRDLRVHILNRLGFSLVGLEYLQELLVDVGGVCKPVLKGAMSVNNEHIKDENREYLYLIDIADSMVEFNRSALGRVCLTSLHGHATQSTYRRSRSLVRKLHHGRPTSATCSSRGRISKLRNALLLLLMSQGGCVGSSLLLLLSLILERFLLGIRVLCSLLLLLSVHCRLQNSTLRGEGSGFLTHLLRVRLWLLLPTWTRLLVKFRSGGMG